MLVLSHVGRSFAVVLRAAPAHFTPPPPSGSPPAATLRPPGVPLRQAQRVGALGLPCLGVHPPRNNGTPPSVLRSDGRATWWLWADHMAGERATTGSADWLLRVERAVRRRFVGPTVCTTIGTPSRRNHLTRQSLPPHTEAAGVLRARGSMVSIRVAADPIGVNSTCVRLCSGWCHQFGLAATGLHVIEALLGCQPIPHRGVRRQSGCRLDDCRMCHTSGPND
jgi:hypothetical protein